MLNLDETKKNIIELFNENKWKYKYDEYEENCLFRINFLMSEDERISKIRFIIDVMQNQILFYSYTNIKIPDNNLSRIFEYICRINWGLINGNFELECDKGVIRYKVLIDTKNNKTGKKELMNSIIISIKMWEKYGSGLFEIMESDRTVRDIVNSIEKLK